MTENRTRRAESRKVSFEGRGRIEGLPKEGKEGFIPEAEEPGEEAGIQSYGHTRRTFNSAFTSTHYFGETPTLRKLSNEIG